MTNLFYAYIDDYQLKTLKHKLCSRYFAVKTKLLLRKSLKAQYICINYNDI